MAQEPTPENIVSDLLEASCIHELQDFLSTVTVAFLVAEDDLSPEFKQNLHHSYNTLQYFLKDLQQIKDSQRCKS